MMGARLLPEDDPDVIDMHVNRILAMSSEELTADLKAQGIDPDEALRRFRKIASEAIASCASTPLPGAIDGGER